MSDTTVQVLQTGRVQVSPRLPFQTGSNQLAVVLCPKRKRIWLPVSVYLVRTSHGNLLFDTGWGTAIRGNQHAYLHFPNYVPNTGELPQGQELVTLLAGCGVAPCDLDVILFSHLDLDHTSGLLEVAGPGIDGAKKVLVCREEWDAAEKSHVRYVHDMWKGVGVTTFEFDDTGFGPFGRSKDLYGDGTLTAVWLPGHTAGSTGLVVRDLQSGHFLILAGDCGYGHQSWEQMVQPGLAVNREQLETSLAWLHEQARDSRCIDVLACHDAGVSPQLIQVC